MTERYVGFYSSRPFWAIDSIDFDDPRISEEFHARMQEIVFKHEEELFKLKICRDGEVLLQIPLLEQDNPFDDEPDISSLVAWWSKYLDYLNSLYLLLDSCVLDVLNLAYIEFSELTRKDAFRVETENDSIRGQNIASESYAALYQMGTFLSMFGQPPQFDMRLMMRQLLPEDVFQCLSGKASVAFSDPSLISNLSMIGKALSEFKSGNYDLALIISWFVTESLISLRWQDFLESINKTYEDGSKRVNSDQMKTLTEGRDFPISVVSNQLELIGGLPTEQFRKVDMVRRYRNKVVHQVPSFVCTADHSRDSIDLAHELALKDSGLQIRLNYSYGVHGP